MENTLPQIVSAPVSARQLFMAVACVAIGIGLGWAAATYPITVSGADTAPVLEDWHGNVRRSYQ